MRPEFTLAPAIADHKPQHQGHDLAFCLIRLAQHIIPACARPRAQFVLLGHTKKASHCHTPHKASEKTSIGFFCFPLLSGAVSRMARRFIQVGK
jgi:hypothetical protein